jgi:hypothetical protein
MQQIRKEGKGPKTFSLGRRIYVHSDAAKRWLKEKADEADAAEDAA